METLVPEGWGEFGVAAAGATAALAGLLVVAISVNIREILASRAAVHGARSTIAALVLGIVTALLFLIPDQPIALLGIETLIATLPAAAIQVASVVAQARGRTEGITTGVFVFIVVLALLQFAPFLVGGVLLLAGLTGGVWVLGAGVIIIVVSAMVGAWVLLIEVQKD